MTGNVTLAVAVAVVLAPGPAKGAPVGGGNEPATSAPAATETPDERDPRTGTTPDEQAFFGPAEFLEKSYIFYSLPPPSPNPTSYGPSVGNPDGSAPYTETHPGKWNWLILEAQPALHFYFWNPLSRHLRDSKNDGPTWLFAPSFTFQTQIRFLSSESNPVRTPSFMPRFNFQFFRLSFPGPDVKFKEVEIILQVGHHSDGQEYCEYQAGFVDNGHCVDIDPAHPDYSKTNLVNGSFGTSYFALGNHWKWVTEIDKNHYASSSYSVGGVFQYHTSHFLPGDLSDTDRKLYGRYRLRGDFEFQRLTSLMPWGRCPGLLGHFRVAAWAQAIFATGPGIAPYQVSAEVSRTFLQAGGAGLFVRFFSGQDYYNINFVHRIDWQAQGGLIMDVESPLYFGTNRHKSWGKAHDGLDGDPPPSSTGWCQ